MVEERKMGKRRGEGGILGKWGGKKRVRKTKGGKKKGKGIKREGEAKGLISRWRGGKQMEESRRGEKGAG